MLTRKRKILLAAALLALWGGIWIWQSWLSQRYGEICTKDPDTYQKYCTAYHLSTVIGWQVGELLNSYSGLVAALATVAIACFTLTLKQATTRLWRASERQADLVRDAMIAGERAFVFCVGLTAFYDAPADPRRPIHNWRFRPRWENSGDTPTKNMTMHTQCVLLDAPLAAGFDFNYVPGPNEIGTALIPPKVTIMGGISPFDPRPAITPQDLIEAQRGTKMLYLWGWAKYFDVFANTPEHVTRFCFALVPKGNPQSRTANKDMSWDFISHTEGNCADDECDN
jgi:hypothetical protein